MTSYPASCDFMVARPPTYNESMENFSRIQNNINNIHNRPIVENNRHIVRENNRPIVRAHYKESNQILVVHRDPYYPPHRKKLRYRLCNIL